MIDNKRGGPMARPGTLGRFLKALERHQWQCLLHKQAVREQPLLVAVSGRRARGLVLPMGLCMQYMCVMVGEKTALVPVLVGRAWGVVPPTGISSRVAWWRA